MLLNSSTYSIALLALATGAVLFGGRPFVVARIKQIFAFAIVVMAAAIGYVSYAQYRLWESAAPAKYLLPPYQGIGYFAQYVGFRFLGPYLLALAIGIVFALAARWYNRKHGEQFFYDEEYWFMALAIFLTGHPGWLFYMFALAATMAVALLLRRIAWKNAEKLSFYYLWFPLGLAAAFAWKWVAALGIFLRLQM